MLPCCVQVLPVLVIIHVAPILLLSLHIPIIAVFPSALIPTALTRLYKIDVKPATTIPFPCCDQVLPVLVNIHVLFVKSYISYPPTIAVFPSALIQTEES